MICGGGPQAWEEGGGARIILWFQSSESSIKNELNKMLSLPPPIGGIGKRESLSPRSLVWQEVMGMI